jgi:hypothetical protein
MSLSHNRVNHKSVRHTPRAIPAVALAAALCGCFLAATVARAQAPAGPATARAAAPALPPAAPASLGAPPDAPPPPPGSATNPRKPLSCLLLPVGVPNGVGAGGAGVIQLVASPGLAGGGAWASPEKTGKLRQRTVNFNFAFSNFDQLMAALQPRRQPGVEYHVEKATTIVVPETSGLSGTHMAELSGVLSGSQRGWSWNDSVTQTRLASSPPFDDNWFISLKLTGQRSDAVRAVPPEFFEQFIRCNLPVTH